MTRKLIAITGVLLLLQISIVQAAAAGSKPLCLLTFKSFLPFSVGAIGNPRIDGHKFSPRRLQADFNGDGCADLAVGAPNYQSFSDSSAGAVHVGYGHNNNERLIARFQGWSENSSGMPGNAATDGSFGFALAAGDFNSDGYTDLAVGAPGKPVKGQDLAGEVTVLYGAASGLSTIGGQVWNQDSIGVPESAESGDYFGAALAAGDFDNDGYADLAIGTPLEDLEEKKAADAGWVGILYGSANGLSAVRAQGWTQDSEGMPGVVESDDNFGHALAAGDFNDDNRFDLAIGAPFEDTSDPKVEEAGWVGIIYGAPEGLSSHRAQGWTQDTPGVPGIGESHDNFGWSLAAGQFDHDRNDDLAIGAPYEDISDNSIEDGGAVTVLYGADDGLHSGRAQVWTLDSNGIEGEAGESDHFGNALSIGDLDADGHFDLIIGAEGKRNRSGAIFTLYGTPNGISSARSQNWYLDDPAIAGVSESGDRFGKAVTAGDYNGDGYWDLVGGIPGREPTGALVTIRGTAAGLTRSGITIWTQVSQGPDSSEFGGVLR